MLIPHDNERVRSIQLSATGVRALLSGVLLVTLVLGVFTLGFFLKQGQEFRAEQLERENVLLAAEVSGMRSQMETLASSLNELAERDEKYRTIAGLPSKDGSVTPCLSRLSVDDVVASSVAPESCALTSMGCGCTTL